MAYLMLMLTSYDIIFIIVNFLSEVYMEFIMLLLVVLAIIVALVASRFIDNGNPFPVQKRQNLFSQIERSFLNLLEKATADKYKIINRVKLSDILELRNNTSDKNKRTTLLKLNAKYMDFVLCDPQDMTIVAVVDLVNNNTKAGHKAVPDWFVNGALETAGIPYLRIKIKAGYTVADLQTVLATRLGKKMVPEQDLRFKGLVKTGPTRPVKPLRPVTDTPALPPMLSQPQIKAQSTAMIQAS